MADRTYTFDDLLGTSTPTPVMTPVATPMATPMATPTPSMTPIATTTPTAQMTPAQPSLWDLTSRGISSGLSDVAALPGQIGTIIENAPSLASALGTKIYNDPLGSLASGARGAGRMVFQGVGGAGGAVGGAALGGLTSPVTGPIGPLVGGIGGLGVGTAAGGLAYDKLENDAVRKANELISLFGGKPFELPNPETPAQQYEKGVREATGAIAGESLLRPLAGLFKFAKGATKYGKATMQEALQEQIPFEGPVQKAFPSKITVSDQQKGVVGDLLVQAGVTPEQLQRAAALKKSGLPEYKNLSTADLLGNEKLKVAESAVAQSPAGQLPFQELNKKQLAELNQMVGDLMSFPGSEGFELGQRIKDSFVKLKQESNDKIRNLYDFLYKQSGQKTYTTTTLAKEIADTVGDIVPEGYARDKSVIDKIIKNLTPKDDVGMPTFGDVSVIDGVKKIATTENRYDIRNLIGVSSRLKTEARALRDKKLGQEALMYDKAADVVDAFIGKTEFSKEFEMANKERAKFAQLFEQGNVSNLDVPFGIAPENVAATLGKNTDQWVQSLKVLGKDQDATRALLTQRLREFDNISDVNAKIKWLDENASLFKSTNAVDDVAKAREQLLRVRDALKKQEKGKEILETVDLDGIGIGELQMAGLTGNPSDSRTIRSFLNASKQATRDKTRQAMAGTTRVAAGLASPAVSVGAALAGSAVGLLFNKRMVEGVQNVNQMMVRALSDPEFALDAISKAGQLTTKREARAALLGSAKKEFTGLAEVLGFGGAEAQKKQALMGAGRAAALNLADALAPVDEEKKPTSSFPSRLAPAPAPTPTPTAAPSAKGGITFDDLLGMESSVPAGKAPTATPQKESQQAPSKSSVLKEITSLFTVPEAEAEARRMPVIKGRKAQMAKLEQASKNFNVKKEIKNYSLMTQSVARVESNLRHNQLSPVGAIGIMQIMPSTAKSLKINPYDPRQNLEGGEKYLDYLHNQFKKPKLTFAAYNMGEGKLARMIKQAGTTNWDKIVDKVGIKSARNKDGVPLETVNYVNKVMKHYSYWR